MSGNDATGSVVTAATDRALIKLLGSIGISSRSSKRDLERGNTPALITILLQKFGMGDKIKSPREAVDYVWQVILRLRKEDAGVNTKVLTNGYNPNVNTSLTRYDQSMSLEQKALSSGAFGTFDYPIEVQVSGNRLAMSYSQFTNSFSAADQEKLLTSGQAGIIEGGVNNPNRVVESLAAYMGKHGPGTAAERKQLAWLGTQQGNAGKVNITVEIQPSGDLAKFIKANKDKLHNGTTLRVI